MNYGTVIDGVITAPLTMRSNFNGIGAWHTLSDDERVQYGWFPCDMVNEAFDQLTESRSETPLLTFDGSRITATYSIVAKTLGTIQSEMLQRLADHRFSFETQGLELSSGLRIKTDRESQGQLFNSYTTLKFELVPDTDWKGVNDWELVELDEIEPIVQAMAAHIRGCFRGERLVSAAISTAKSIADVLVIDIALDFAQAYREAVDEVMTPKQATE